MSGFVDAKEREIIHRFESSLLLSVDGIRFEVFTLEVFAAGELDLVDYLMVSEPVADPVGIPGPHQDCESALNHAGKVWEECARIYPVLVRVLSHT